VVCSNNTGVGTADVAVTGKGNYAGSTGNATFEIMQATVVVQWSNTQTVYSGSAQLPAASAVGAGALSVQPGAKTDAGSYRLWAVSADPNIRLSNDTTDFVINKAAGASLNSAPTLSTKSEEEITVNPVTSVNGQAVEYAIATSDNALPTTGWQDSTTFSGLTTNSTYYVYARTAENSNYTAGAALTSAAITIETFTPADDQAELLSVTVNNVPVAIEELAAACSEYNATVELTVSPGAKVKIDGTLYEEPTVTIDLPAGVTTVNIEIQSRSESNVTQHTLAITAPIASDSIYFQRWSDVLAVNHNPTKNGGYNVSDVRWYKNGTFIGSEKYVNYEGAQHEYSAEVKIDGYWYKVLPFVAKLITRPIAWPNPVQVGETYTLHLPKHYLGGRMDIYTASGTKIKSDIVLESEQVTLHADLAGSGIYLLTITSREGERETVKIIVK
jgi:hypothetical protein